MKTIKNKVIYGAVVTLIGAGGFVPTIASATGTTEGSLTFTDTGGTTQPVDPSDPSKPAPGGIDVDHTATGNTGNLTLDVVPKTFKFGTQAVASAERTYQAEKTVNDYQYIQVSDNRADVNGWTVSIQQDSELTDGGNTLTGARITIPAGEARNSLSATPTAVDPDLTTHEVTVTGSAQKIFQAPDTAGVGKDVSVNRWNSEDVSITIPQLTAKAGAFTNTLTWTLTAGVTR
ncbi:WxL domain-containing protein [Carnobacterium gallinarum]|uniref:WxL domain-containing protein n=1 Tax=Carnobacterium gallinarum TaxID=2749 RepID=UPI00068FED3A|nr:WxL domain-containing protein [Carnobacterium gallinarum]